MTAQWCPLSWISGSEDGDGGNLHRGGQMRQPGIMSNIQSSPGEYTGHRFQALTLNHRDIV